MLLVHAADQATATAVAKVANPLMLHLPTADMAYLPSLAFATSPAETERGATATSTPASTTYRWQSSHCRERGDGCRAPVRNSLTDHNGRCALCWGENKTVMAP